MSQRLKRWESPRRSGRNDKGRGGSARQRQKQKQMKLLKQKLQQSELDKPDSRKSDSSRHNLREGKRTMLPSFVFGFCRSVPNLVPKIPNNSGSVL